MSELPGNTNRDGAGLNKGSSNGPLSLRDRVKSLRLPERPAPQRSATAWVPWALCVGLGAAAVYFAAHSSAGAPAETGAAQGGKAAERSQGAAGDDALAPGEVVLESQGYIIPVRQIQVSPKVSGMVLKLNIIEGMQVKEGQILAELETVEYKSDYDRQRGLADGAWNRWLELAHGYRPEEIEQAKADLEEAEAVLTQRDQEYKRNTGLRGGGAVAQRDLEMAESDYRAMVKRVLSKRLNHKLMEEGPRAERIEAAWAEVCQLEAECVKAKWRLDNCMVRSPVTGTILVKRAEEGNMVNPSAFSNGLSASLCDMADLAELEVDLSVPERDIGRLLTFTKQKCQVRAEAFPRRAYDGYVSRLMPQADRAKGAVPVRVKILIPREEAGRYLRPEMRAAVTFLNLESQVAPGIEGRKGP